MFEQRDRPGAVVNLVRTKLVGRLDLITRVRIVKIQGQRRNAAAAFLTAGAVPFVGKKMLQRREQERTKPPALARDAFQRVFCKEAFEERLREVLGVLLRVA